MASGTRNKILHQLDGILRDIRSAQKHVTYIKELAPEGHEATEKLMENGLQGLLAIEDIFQGVRNTW